MHVLGSPRSRKITFMSLWSKMRHCCTNFPYPSLCLARSLWITNSCETFCLRGTANMWCDRTQYTISSISDSFSVSLWLSTKLQCSYMFSSTYYFLFGYVSFGCKSCSINSSSSSSSYSQLIPRCMRLLVHWVFVFSFFPHATLSSQSKQNSAFDFRFFQNACFFS